MNTQMQPSCESCRTRDLKYWRNPTGVAVDFDTLRFLYVPDHVESRMVADLALQVFAWQKKHRGSEDQITRAVMVTMGGMLPGVLLHDHLAWHADPDIPAVEFGTLGVKYYAGPGVPLERPIIVQNMTINVRNHVVGVVEDLVDLGGTARFVADYLAIHGARASVLIAPWLKNREVLNTMPVINFGFVPADTWIIMPRERVETLIKRVPHWRGGGGDLAACAANLRSIGYPDYLIEQYLPAAFEA
ncbi:MAG: hypothetical protein OXF32_12735 [Anaerolineaceae bacterium]|nr:hypothetical protein [Anaerolineaceae bacterium]